MSIESGSSWSLEDQKPSEEKKTTEQTPQESSDDMIAEETSATVPEQKTETESENGKEKLEGQFPTEEDILNRATYWLDVHFSEQSSMYNEYSAMASGKDPGGIRETYYKGWRDKDFEKLVYEIRKLNDKAGSKKIPL